MHNITKAAIMSLIVIIAWVGFSIGLSTQMSPTQAEIDTVWNNIIELENSGVIGKQLAGQLVFSSET